MMWLMLGYAFLQILKFEWPANWPAFIGDIVGASKTNESLCQNNMIILKLLRCVLGFSYIDLLLAVWITTVPTLHMCSCVKAEIYR